MFAVTRDDSEPIPFPKPATLARRSRGDELRHVMSASTGFMPTYARSLRRLRNGVEIFPAMLAAIAEAKRSVAFVTFVYWTGEIAERFAEALADAARRGVTVRVVLDSFGARQMDSSLVDRMRAAGVEVRWFRPLRTWRVWRSSHRTHRKLLIIDGHLGYTGGVGIAEEWEGDARDASEWRDTHFEIEGPVVTALWGAFVGTWLESGGEPLPAPRPPEPYDSEPTLPVLAIPTTGAIGWSRTAGAFWNLMRSAKRSLRIATAYFTPDHRTLAALIEAAQSGVRVEILLPGEHTDSPLVKLASVRHLQPLIDAGARVYQFQPTMMHAKLIIVDDALVCFGSANLNSRSMSKDEEILIASTSSELITTLLEDFEADLARSRELTEVDVPWWRWLLSKLVKPLRSEL